MDLGKTISITVGSLTIVGALIGAGKVIDARYAHHDEIVRLAQETDRRILENQLAAYRLELQALRNKATPTTDDADRMAYLSKVIALIQQQLDGIVGGA